MYFEGNRMKNYEVVRTKEDVLLKYELILMKLCV